MDLSGVPFIFHFEVPQVKETFLSRVLKSGPEEVVAITFATDMELVDVRKIEQSLGARIQVMDLPEELVVDQPGKKAKLTKTEL